MRGRALLVAGAMLGTMAAAPASPTHHATSHISGTPDRNDPQVVVAVNDTGVNPYHEIYRRPELTTHPCTWLEGYDDCSVPALDLTLDTALTYEEALAADQATWEAVEPGQWYWVPGTNIVGMQCDGSGTGPAYEEVRNDHDLCALDPRGHGTGTTSSILTEAPEALILSRQASHGSTDFDRAPVRPDLQSLSKAQPVPAPGTVDRALPGEPFLCGQHATGDLLFHSAGNEAPLPAAADCVRGAPGVVIVGGSWPGRATSNSWATADVTSWYCRPVATHDSRDAWRTACGTSFSAPTAAGVAATVLLELRRREGFAGRRVGTQLTPQVDRDDLTDALLGGTTFTPGRRFDVDPQPQHTTFPLPEQAPWLFWGHGWLDASRTDAVLSCAAGDCRAVQADEVAWHDARRTLRATSNDTGDVVPQDDAGSGRDAGHAPGTAITVTGRSGWSGLLASPIDIDGYLVELAAGARVTVTATATSPIPPCLRLRDLGGEVLAEGGCKDGPEDFTVTGPAVMTYEVATSGVHLVTLVSSVESTDYDVTVEIE